MFELEQLPALLGASIVLLAFALLKLKVISAHGNWFDWLNLMGCGILLVTALIDWRIGFIILNAVWAMVSAWSILRRRWIGKAKSQSEQA